MSSLAYILLPTNDSIADFQWLEHLWKNEKMIVTGSAI